MFEPLFEVKDLLKLSKKRSSFCHSLLVSLSYDLNDLISQQGAEPVLGELDGELKEKMAGSDHVVHLAGKSALEVSKNGGVTPSKTLLLTLFHREQLKIFFG